MDNTVYYTVQAHVFNDPKKSRLVKILERLCLGIFNFTLLQFQFVCWAMMLLISLQGDFNSLTKFTVGT